MIEVQRLGEKNFVDFFRVHSAANDHAWCFCAAWWVPTWEGWGERSADENRALRQDLFDRRNFDGYLLYLDSAPIGWCQAGQRDRFPKLLNSYALQADERAAAITCFFLAPMVRNQGLAHTFLAGVLADLKQQEFTYVQAFPHVGEGLPPDDVWTGPLPVFTRAGFTVLKAHATRPVYEKVL